MVAAPLRPPKLSGLYACGKSRAGDGWGESLGLRKTLTSPAPSVSGLTKEPEARETMLAGINRTDKPGVFLPL